jgi:hypothetical protein
MSNQELILPKSYQKALKPRIEIHCCTVKIPNLLVQWHEEEKIRRIVPHLSHEAKKLDKISFTRLRWDVWSDEEDLGFGLRFRIRNSFWIIKRGFFFFELYWCITSVRISIEVFVGTKEASSLQVPIFPTNLKLKWFWY